ncbi:MAG: hypothetical protein ABI315_07915 [Bacteroidia bacterium]
MINTFNYIVSKLPAVDVVESIKNTTVFSLELNNIEDIQKINFQEIYANPISLSNSCFFSIYINVSNEAQSIVNALVSKEILLQLFFHTRFIKIDNKPVIFIDQKNDKNEKVNSFLLEITAFCILNGFEGVELIFLETDQNKIQTKALLIYPFVSQMVLGDSYFHLLQTKFYTANIFSISNIPEECLIDVNKTLLDTEKKLMIDFTSQYNYMNSFYELTQKIELLENELSHTKNDLKNQKIYLNFFKSQDEALKIYEFYSNEYEILPLWYKRVGHIIKVLTMKRTFRSLFDNNVKKYKN